MLCELFPRLLSGQHKFAGADLDASEVPAFGRLVKALAEFVGGHIGLGRYPDLGYREMAAQTPCGIAVGVVSEWTDLVPRPVSGPMEEPEMARGPPDAGGVATLLLRNGHGYDASIAARTSAAAIVCTLRLRCDKPIAASPYADPIRQIKSSLRFTASIDATSRAAS